MTRRLIDELVAAEALEHELIEVTSFGSEPQYVHGRNGQDTAIAKAREYYATGRISLDELDKALNAILRWQP